MTVALPADAFLDVNFKMDSPVGIQGCSFYFRNILTQYSILQTNKGSIKKAKCCVMAPVPDLKKDSTCSNIHQKERIQRVINDIIQGCLHD